MEHGEGMTRLYRCWSTMKSRCRNPHSESFKYYGERGLDVCDEWADSYLAFKEWAINNGYSDELTIDRIDNNKGYSPQNCRWANAYVQMNNRNFNHKVTYNGETHTLAEWEKLTGIKQTKIRQRLKKGLPLEKVFYNGDLRKKVI